MLAAAILGSAAIQAGTSYLSGKAAGKASQNALADAQARASETNQVAMNALYPYRVAGRGAVEQLDQIYNGDGLDVTPYIDSPQYQFLQQEGENALLRNKSALGRLASGESQRDLTAFGQGLASTEFDNYVNKLFGLSGIGQNATGQLLNVMTGADARLTSAGFANAAGQAGAADTIYSGIGNAANNAIGNTIFANALAQNDTSSYGIPSNPALVGSPPMQNALLGLG